MSNALLLSGNEEVKETATFIQLMDKFFDCMNVKNFSQGSHKRKQFQMSYKSGADSRLTVSNNSYIYNAQCYFSDFVTSFLDTLTNGKNL